MKRAVILFTLIFFFLEIGGVYSQYQNRDDTIKIKGGYKQSICYKYNYNNGNLDTKKRIKVSTCKYDDKGNCIEELYSLHNDSIGTKHISKYDNYGRIIVNEVYVSGDSNKYKAEFKYDKNGNLVKILYFENNVLLPLTTEYKYNDIGKMVSYISKESDAIETKFKYNDKGYKIEALNLYVDTCDKYRVIYKYNEKGFLKEEISISSYWKNTQKNTFLYDKNANLIEVINTKHCFSDKIPIKYDIDENMIEELFQSNFCTKNKKTYIYDENRNLVSLIFWSYDKSGFEAYRKYEYIYSK